LGSPAVDPSSCRGPDQIDQVLAYGPYPGQLRDVETGTDFAADAVAKIIAR
jgi:hypothetical protein